MAPRENLGIPNLVNNFPGLVPPPAPNSNLFPPPIDIKYAPPASFSGGAREVNDATVKLVKNFESFVPSPAPDPYGFLTVGYGHRCQKPGCGEVRQEFPLTPKTASELMRGDLSRFEKCITRALADSNVQLTDNQYGALVSLAYNAGEKGVSSSNLIKRLRAGEDPNTVIEQEMPDWKRSGGKISQGLINRRKREIEFFKEG
ncbi:lysozyme-like domain-containing protein [Coprinopsis sp. MPI-PUGE-AT-0042]|nr:lysozyme-like domain-containing protein [Coprinopsis sp. MPI-PUGE-AT-0042]